MYIHTHNIMSFILLTGNAMASAHVNPAYAMNEAFASNNKMDSEKIAISQDVKLTDNIY